MTEKEYIELKKEELNYIENVFNLSASKKLSETEIIEIARKLNDYAVKLSKMYAEYCKDEYKEIEFEFDVNSNYLSNCNYRKNVLAQLGIDIETNKFTAEFHYAGINLSYILNGQNLRCVYIYNGIVHDEEGSFERYSYFRTIPLNQHYTYYEEYSVYDKEGKEEFEKGKTIIQSKPYVYSDKIPLILSQEFFNDKNKTFDDCIKATEKRIEELSRTNSPEYKEKVLLDRVSKLYQKVKGELIKEESLYKGEFLNILEETYRLPNDKIVRKEKVVKNNNKNAVVVVAITSVNRFVNKYIITFQNRINNKLIAEFPAGYIEENEEVLEAAKRELKEETGYTAGNIFILDEVYTSPGIDNSVTYVAVASDCIKTDEKSTEGTEYVDYDLFTEDELKYLIENNIMSGGINKLAYYSLKDNGSIYQKKLK